jgi:ribonucleotide monophosphatase NagD (HAD superfamily)
MDGVLKGMTSELEYGAIKLINKLYGLQKKIFYITNNPNLSREEFVKDLLARGIHFGGVFKLKLDGRNFGCNKHGILVDGELDDLFTHNGRTGNNFKPFLKNDRKIDGNDFMSLFEQSILNEQINVIKQYMFCVAFLIKQFLESHNNTATDYDKIRPLLYVSQEDIRDTRDDIFYHKESFPFPGKYDKGIVAEIKQSDYYKDNSKYAVIDYHNYIRQGNTSPTYSMIKYILDNNYNALIYGWDGTPDPKFILLLGNIIYVLGTIGYKFRIIVCSPDPSGSVDPIINESWQKKGELKLDCSKKEFENICKMRGVSDNIDITETYKDILKNRAIGTGSVGRFFMEVSTISTEIEYIGKPSDFLISYINALFVERVTSNGQLKKPESGKKNTLMIGDTVSTDIIFGNSIKYTDTLLLYSGATNHNEMEKIASGIKNQNDALYANISLFLFYPTHNDPNILTLGLTEKEKKRMREYKKDNNIAALLQFLSKKLYDHKMKPTYSVEALTYLN